MPRRSLARHTIAVAILAACLLLPSPAAAAEPPVSAPDPLQPAPAAYVVQGFGTDPLGEAGPSLAVSLDPAIPDGYFGWYVSPLRVTLWASRPSVVRYCWDDPAGSWRLYDGQLIVPEGKHVLYARASDQRGAGPLTAIQVKVDFRSPHVNGAEFRQLEESVKASAEADGVVTVSATVRPYAGPRVIRIGGKDRYETSELISRTDFGSSTAAIVARGDLFPDALAASGLAGIYNAPIILTKPTLLTPAAAAALSGLGATDVIIVGSEKAVSAGVESALRMRGLNVERIGGIDRYETAALISRAVVARGGSRGRAFVTRGDLFPDSLAASPFAYADRRPILLVKPRALPPVTSKALVDLGIGQILIAGDPNAVSAGVEGQIRSVSGAAIDRRAGPDRYLTAIQVARWGTASGLGDFHLVGIATGQRFPDALCGGAAVGQLRGVMMMTPPDQLHPAVASELTAHGPELRDVQVYGSEAAVSKAGWEGILKAVR